mmetsp:Transcript_2389/g.3348  ORF Transcript_2389/g.3348 Transcript_2389/m.3348 type:complete len:542 (-) Transcript_2389:1575-3200(-)
MGPHVEEEFDGNAVKLTNPIMVPEVPIAPTAPEVEMEHEALIGREYSTEAAAMRNPTIATFGDTLVEQKGGDEAQAMEHHKIVATEVVPNPMAIQAPAILQNAVVIIDPKIADCTQFVESATKRGLFVTAVVPKPNKGDEQIEYHPTAEAILETGVNQVYEPPMGAKFDIVECANHLKTIESQQNIRYLGVLPLRESAVDYSDILAALLGITVHNDLGHSSARRDKALMKNAVSNAGLRVAKFARLTASDGSDVPPAIEELELEFPVVVKTPRGMSTMDVYICQNMEEAIQRSSQIVKSVGPDGRKAQFSLLEEFLIGDEFAVNLLASPTTPRGVQVTDVWKYEKYSGEGTMVNTWQSMCDPHSKTYSNLVRYAEGIARAVGIKFGMAHVELKSVYNEERGKYIEPVMIEVGARLAGGKKAIMAEKTVPGWCPFDAMLDAHCGFPIQVPPSFSPALHAKHVYIPSKQVGVVKSISGADFERLETYDSHIMLCEPGSKVTVSTDIYSFAGFVWLIGKYEDVERDARLARDGFSIEVEEEVEQ